MNIKIPVLFLFIVNTHLASFAQYGDAYHRPNTYLIEKEQRQYGEKQREMARANSNSTSTSGSGGSGSNDRDLENWVKSNFGKKEQKQIAVSPEQAARIAQLGRVSAAESARQSDVRAKRKPFVDIFMKAGLNETEAEIVARNHIIDYDGRLNPDYIKALEIEPLIISLNKDLATMSFDSLRDKIEVLNYFTPLTSFNILDKVKDRFTEEKPEIENLQINCMVAYFNTRAGGNNEDYEGRKKLLDLYFKLEKKYPELDVFVMERTNFDDPYRSKIDLIRYYGATSKETSKLFSMAAGVESKVDKKWDAICQTSAGIEAALAADKAFSLTQIISKKYKNEYGSRMDATKFNENKQAQLSHIQNFNVLSFSGKNYDAHMRCSPKVLKELADHGNFDAQYIYTLYLCAQGTDAQIKEQSETYLKKAGEGDYFSLQLLFLSRIWQIVHRTPRLTDAEVKQHYNDLKASIERSKIPEADLFNLANHLNSCFANLIVYTPEKYPQLDAYRYYGNYLALKYKPKN